MSSSLKVWDEVDDSAFDEIDKTIKSFNTGTIWTLSNGRNVMRFLPPKKGAKPYKIVHEHFVEDPGSEKKLRFVCPRYTSKGKLRCPRCEERDRLASSNNSLDRRESKEYSPRLRVYANVINRDAPEEGPKVIGFGKMVWDALREIKDDPQGGPFWDPTDKGFDIIIKRVGESRFDTKYTVQMAKKNSVLSEDEEQMAEWIENQPDLEQQALLTDPEELMDLLAGGGGRGRKSLRESGDDDERGSRRSLSAGSGSSGAAKTKKKSARRAQDEIDGPTLDADFSESGDDDDDIPL